MPVLSTNAVPFTLYSQKKQLAVASAGLLVRGAFSGLCHSRDAGPRVKGDGSSLPPSQLALLWRKALLFSVGTAGGTFAMKGAHG